MRDNERPSDRPLGAGRKDSAGEPFHTELAEVDLMGMRLAACSESTLLDEIYRAIGEARGGWLITANLDFLRLHHQQQDLRSLYAEADLRVADGMPLVWAARLQGTPLPERVAGSSLVHPLAERASREGRSLYFLGGATGTAEATALRLQREFPSLRVAGHSCPWLPAEPDDDAIQETLALLTQANPDIVLVALGSPKQEYLIRLLRRHLPRAWFVGVGMSFSFTTGHMRRAPSWMQHSGLEWMHRLASEPRRLSARYLWHDAPFGVRLLTGSLVRGLRKRVGARAVLF